MNIIKRILDVIIDRIASWIWDSGARPRAANLSPGSSFPTFPDRARTSFSLPVHNTPKSTSTFYRRRGAKPDTKNQVMP